MGKFDSKSFNEKAFKYSVDRIPNLKKNELKKSKALTGNEDIKKVFSDENGTAYARIAMSGLLEGDAVNYDGQTDITATSTKTFERGVVVVGRAKGFVEKDFSYDVTGGKDFMQNVAEQIADYKDRLDQNTLLAVLKGIFSMTGAKNLEFVNKHTTEVKGNIQATTLNTATNKACGANKKKFALVFMHSDVSTNIENLNLLEHLKYTDENGITRELDLGTWNGKIVIIDDDMPTKDVEATYVKTNDKTIVAGKTYYTKTGTKYTAVSNPVEGSIGDYYELADEAHTEYTTYVLGIGAIDFEDVGVKRPYEMDRDPSKNGGQDTLYIRQRKVFAPYGISYEKKVQASLSPTNEELENGSNWNLVNSGEESEGDRSYINHKAIPIARIISRG